MFGHELSLDCHSNPYFSTAMQDDLESFDNESSEERERKRVRFLTF